MAELTTAISEARPGGAVSSGAARASLSARRAEQRLARRAISSQLGVVLPPLLVVVAVVAAWQMWVSLFHVPRYLVPAPSRVWQRVIDDRAALWQAFQSTATSALLGYLAAIALGFLVAVAFASNRVVQRCFYPFAITLQTVPIIAIAPIIIVWAGPGKLAIVIITFIITVFPVIANATIGLMSTDHNLLNLFAINNASRLQLLWKLRLPNAMPYIVTGLKISAGLSVIGAIVGEFFAGRGGASSGLGSLITFSSARLQTDMLFAATLTASLLGIGFFLVINQLGNYAVRNWHESATKREN